MRNRKRSVGDGNTHRGLARHPRLRPHVGVLIEADVVLQIGAERPERPIETRIELRPPPPGFRCEREVFLAQVADQGAVATTELVAVSPALDRVNVVERAGAGIRGERERRGGIRREDVRERDHAAVEGIDGTRIDLQRPAGVEFDVSIDV